MGNRYNEHARDGFIQNEKIHSRISIKLPAYLINQNPILS